MSTTAAIIITDALTEISVIGEDQVPSAKMMDDGLRMLNRLLNVLSTNGDWAYYPSQIQIALTGQQSFTIGPLTGDITTNRPIKVDTAVVDRLGITYPVKVIDNQRYDILTYKALQGANTQAIYYEAQYPLGIVYCYPIATGCTLQMRVLNSVKQFADLSVQIELPEGYEDAIMLALARRMAPSYGKQISPETRLAAINAMKAVMQVNQVIPTLELPNAVMGNTGSTYSAFMSGD
jgi:hypothetical protein